MSPSEQRELGKVISERHKKDMKALAEDLEGELAFETAFLLGVYYGGYLKGLACGTRNMKERMRKPQD